MQSEHSSIDELFRKKEEAWLPPGNREEAHWHQMKAMLAAPGVTPPRKKTGKIINRRIFMYTSGIVIITVIVTTLLLHTARNGRSNNLAAVKAIPQKNNPVRPADKAVTFTTTSIAVSQHRPKQKNNNYTIVTVISRYIAGAAGGKPVKRNADTATAIPVKEAPDATALLNRFYSQLQQEPQEFLINTFRDTLLVAKQGTRLFIPSRAFVSKTGKAITGTVKIVLEEFYSYDKMIAAGLGTTSNGEQLVSGGMLHIMALSEGHELLLQPSINITVKMPTNNYDGRMQLFTGNIPQKTPPAGARDFIDAAQVSFHNVGDTSAYTPAAAPGNKEINWLASGQWQQSYKRPDIKVWDLRNEPDQVNYRRNTSIAIFYIHRHHGPNKDIIKKELEKRYGYYYNKIKVKSTDAAEVGLFKPRKISIVGDSVNMSLDEAIKNKLVSPADSLAYINRVTADSIAYFTKAGKLKDYTFNISNLGWINCDRFSKDPRPRVEFVVDLGAGANASLFHSQLVFSRYQSLVPGYYHDTRLSYGKIPKGEPVTLVCLGVKDGKVVSCIESFAASAGEINNLHFEETTPEQFKSKLKALNLSTQ